MRVLHVFSHFAALSETFLHDTVQEQLSEGVDVLCACKTREDHPGRERVPVVQLAPAGLLARLTPERVRSSRALFSSGLLATMVGYSPDIVHCHYGTTALSALPALARYQVPVVVSFHGFDASSVPQREGNTVYDRLWPRADCVTVVSSAMLEKLVELGCPRNKLTIVHVGMRNDSMAFRTSVAEGPYRIVSVGRLVEKKGFDLAIGALSELRERGYDAVLDILGDGPERERLSARAAESKHPDCIRFRGAVSRTAVFEAMAGAHVLLQPSRTASNGDMEGIPTVLLEAHAMGTPTVATRHSGVPEAYPENLRGSLANEGDLNGLVKACREIFESDPAALRARREACRAHVRKEFDLTIESQRLISVYADLACGARMFPERVPVRNSDGVSDWYDGFFAQRMLSYRVHRNIRLEAAIERITELTAGRATLLDIGCGIGAVTNAVATRRPGLLTFGVDLSPRNAAYAEQTSRDRARQIFTAFDVIADPTRLLDLLGSQRADIVTLVDVIEHIPAGSWGRLFANIEDVLSLHGLVFISYPSAAYQRQLLDEDPTELQVIDQIVEIDDLAVALRAAGLAIVSVTHFDAWTRGQYVHVVCRRESELRAEVVSTARQSRPIAKRLAAGSRRVADRLSRLRIRQG